MPRKIKIPIQAMEDVKPEPRPMSGGSVCVICKEHLDKMEEEDKKMEGAGYLSKAAEKVEKTTRKGASKVKKAGKKAGKYITDVEGLTSDIVNYGIPATTAALLGTPAGMVGGPVAGVAASALGSKLGTMAADKIAKETAIESRTGEGLKPKRKAKFEKGSQEAKDYMAQLRAKRGKK